MKNILLTKNISKSFDGTKVLKEINLSINQGEIISISGPSGAGKTTLLNILGTIETPDDNNDSKLMICERDIFGLNDKLENVVNHIMDLPHDTLVYAIGNQVGSGQDILTQISKYRHHG